MNEKLSKFKELFEQSYHSGDKVDTSFGNKINEYRVQLISPKGEIVNFTFNDIERIGARQIMREYES